jgi:hypothetical protein
MQFGFDACFNISKNTDWKRFKMNPDFSVNGQCLIESERTTLLSRLKDEFKLNFISRFGPYRAVNILCLGCGNNRCLSSDPHNYTVWAEPKIYVLNLAVRIVTTGL